MPPSFTSKGSWDELCQGPLVAAALPCATSFSDIPILSRCVNLVTTIPPPSPLLPSPPSLPILWSYLGNIFILNFCSGGEEDDPTVTNIDEMQPQEGDDGYLRMMDALRDSRLLKGWWTLPVVLLSVPIYFAFPERGWIAGLGTRTTQAWKLELWVQQCLPHPLFPCVYLEDTKTSIV